MYSIRSIRERNCQGTTRRELLRVGGVSALGLSLSQAVAGGAARAEPRASLNCIFLFLWGGPSQYETFDPKPEAVAEIRGPFGAVPTTVDGLRYCDQLPMLARLANRLSTIRNMHHGNGLHPHSGSYAQAGRFPVPGQRFPNHGAVVARFGGPSSAALPPFARVGPEVWDSAGEITAQDGGFLGGAYDPFVIRDPREPLDRIAALAPPAGLDGSRLGRRRSLMERLDRLQARIEGAGTATHDAAYERAFALVTSPQAKQALDLSREPAGVRERYGHTLPGQSALMARRLVEAGVRFVQVNWSRVGNQQGWDTHGRGNGGSAAEMKDYLLPTLDRSVSALVEDLAQRGLDRSTLLVVVGEFGRTHRLNRGAGRDHWPGVYSALMFGGGVPAGLVVGRSDDSGMYPDGPHCTPDDLSITLFRLLDLDVSAALRTARVVEAAPGIPGITPDEKPVA